MVREFGLMVIAVAVSAACSRAEDSASDVPQEVKTHALTDVPALAESQFTQEVRDGAWAGGREGLLASEVTHVSGILLLSAECKATICKVRLQANEPTAVDRLQSYLRAPENGDLYRGGVKAVLARDPSGDGASWWVSRPGYNLDGSQRRKATIPSGE
jgi:hypothetical protein